MNDVAYSVKFLCCAIMLQSWPSQPSSRRVQKQCSSWKKPYTSIMFGWFRNACILSQRINCSRILSWMIFFFSSTFIAITNPVLISLTRNTLPNLPSPNLFKNLKLSLEILPRLLSLIISLGFDLKNAGDELGDTLRLLV